MCQNHNNDNNKCRKSAKESIDSVKSEYKNAMKWVLQVMEEKHELQEENDYLGKMLEESQNECQKLKSEIAIANKNVSIWQKVVFLLNGKSSNTTK